MESKFPRVLNSYRGELLQRKVRLVVRLRVEQPLQLRPGARAEPLLLRHRRPVEPALVEAGAHLGERIGEFAEQSAFE